LFAIPVVSAQTLHNVDTAVRKIVSDAEERALRILQCRRATLRVASALAEQESLNEAELASLLDVQPRRRRTTARP
jgi:ATP-dependent Zn protease